MFRVKLLKQPALKNMDSVLSGGNLTSAQKEELMEQVKQQIAIANVQELVTVSSYF